MAQKFITRSSLPISLGPSLLMVFIFQTVEAVNSYKLAFNRKVSLLLESPPLEKTQNSSPAEVIKCQ